MKDISQVLCGPVACNRKQTSFAKCFETMLNLPLIKNCNKTTNICPGNYNT